MTKSTFEQVEYRPEIPGDDIAVHKLSAQELGVADNARPKEYTLVPAIAYHLFPPSGRLLLALLFARRVFGENAPGGWIRLGQGLTNRFGLKDKDVRRRAVLALEAAGAVEVKRKPGAASLLRLRQGAHDHG